MASRQKYSNGQTPSKGTVGPVGVVSDSTFHTAGVSPESKEAGIMSPEKHAAVGAGGKDFRLTSHEKQVLLLVVAGYTNRDIAREFGLSEQTIKHHVAQIFDKLGVSNRLELLLSALHHQLID